MEEKIKQQGIIYVSASVSGELGHPLTCEEWKKALMLPGDYDVESVGLPQLYGEFVLRQSELYTLYVRHEDIPKVVGCSRLPEVVPYYRRDGEKAVLTRIEIRQWIDNEWQIDAKQIYEKCEV